MFLAACYLSPWNHMPSKIQVQIKQGEWELEKMPNVGIQEWDRQWHLKVPKQPATLSPVLFNAKKGLSS